MTSGARPYTQEQRERAFWAKVNITDGCWLWTATTNNKGYGNFKFNKKYVGAHRASWMIHNGPIPKGKFVLHTCDNPPCVNPDHLFIGTNEDNLKDMAKKGRSTRGEKNVNAVLTEERVIAIRADIRTQDAIAAAYNISQRQVSRIKRKLNWAHVV